MTTESSHMTTKAIAWPDPSSVVISTGHKTYKTPDGIMHGTTRVIKVLGLSTEALVRWSANVERAAVLEAAETVLAQSRGMTTPKDFTAAVEKAIGPAKQHQREMQKAGDIGTEIHQAISDFLRIGTMPKGSRDEVDWALMAFDEWWAKSKLKSIRTEQPVWDKALGYAGTIDLVAENQQGQLGVIDFKTSKGIYDDHHLQVAAYLHAGSNFAPLEWAQIVRLPKNVEDPKFEVKPLGAMYDRQLTRSQLMEAFAGALAAYKVLVAK